MKDRRRDRDVLLGLRGWADNRIHFQSPREMRMHILKELGTDIGSDIIINWLGWWLCQHAFRRGRGFEGMEDDQT